MSIYESGSSDDTTHLLNELKGHLDFLGVPYSIVCGNALRENTNRIEFLAKLRNKAMEPLEMLPNSYDQVVWLNDVMYCAESVLQVILLNFTGSQIYNLCLKYA